jgi:hypothetical protein
MLKLAVHKESLGLYTVNQMEEVEMDGACRTHDSDETCTKILVGKYGAEISRCSWKDITNLTLKKD